MALQKVDRYNVALKRAVLDAKDAKGRPLTQRIVSRRARIHESRFSRIVRGWDEATANERRRLATVLKRAEQDLFPDLNAAVPA